MLSFLIVSCAKISFAQESDLAISHENNLPIFDFEASEDINLLEAPQCDNPILFEKVIEKIKLFASQLKAESTISKRKKALILANIKKFEKVNIDDITPDTNFKTANALITLKINKNIKDKDFVVCKQSDIKETPLYLIIYPYMDNYKVDIINLDPNSNNFEKYSFIYP